MVFDWLLYGALTISILGLVYKISTWFTRKIGFAAGNFTTSERVFSAARGIFTVVFSEKLILLIKVFIFDVLLQVRILKEDFLRWLMHMLIFWGFMLLLAVHALDGIIIEPWVSHYYPTINPFLFLRDLFGFMVIVGIGIAIVRRCFLKVPRLKTNAMDYYAIAILAVIILSGIFLEGLKITSHSEFSAMQEDYAGLEDENEIQALESHWVQKYGLISPNVKAPFDEDVLSLGEELNADYCIDCHSRPQSAFTGNTAGKIIGPIAVALDRVGGVAILWHIHILSCFLGLAYLPFSKFFHIFATPVSLLAGAVMDNDRSAPANIATRQALELDACMHCGTCSLHCSVGAAFYKIGNRNILPSEKIQFLKAYAANKNLTPEGLRAIQEGIYLCTNCDRCTLVCPAGIGLKDLWFNVREELIQKKQPVPLVLSQFSFYRGLSQQQLDSQNYSKPLATAKEAVTAKFESIVNTDAVIPLTPVNQDFKGKADRSSEGNTYAYCFSCENCSTVCPVVENYENPQAIVGMLPHQIMRSLGLGLRDLALGSKMLWDCMTCYQCQEHCPQAVKVTDILYELKNRAVKESMTLPDDKKQPSV